MAIARMRQIDASVARWYHRMTRCVRRALLLDEGTFDRKAWIETGRLFRARNAAISAELARVFGRLSTHADRWRIRLEKLRTGRLFGRFFAATRDRLKQEAGRLGVRSVWNLGGCPVR
jgi:hypothetical protein